MLKVVGLFFDKDSQPDTAIYAFDI